MDTELLEALPNDRLARRLAFLDMSTDQVPTIRIPLTQRMTMHQEHETVRTSTATAIGIRATMAARYARMRSHAVVRLMRPMPMSESWCSSL